MRKLFGCIVIAATVGFASALLAGELSPITLGGGETATQQANGQIIEISISGPVQVTVYFDVVAPDKVSGVTVRTSGGTSSGSVTIKWLNTNTQVTLNLSESNTTQEFSLEGGDGDKRAPSNNLQ